MEIKMKKTHLLIIGMLIGLMISACAGGVGSSASIVGEWELVSYGSAASPTLALPDVETTISFGEDGRFGGNVGCNGFGAEYKVSGDEITFDAIVSTMMYCEAVAEQESGVIGTLSENPVTFQLNGNTLTLTSANGASVVVLARK
jgi:heat shock protein HslJ